MMRLCSDGWHDRWVGCNLTGRNVWIGLTRFRPIGTNGLGDCHILVSSNREAGWPGSGGGVGRGNKFVLLDITEEPEAKKLTVYNTNEI